MHPEDVRYEFEHWATTEAMPILDTRRWGWEDTIPKGRDVCDYVQPDTRIAWQAWQARQAYEVGGEQPPACAEVLGEAGSGVALIAAERRRQVEAEGWTAEHDDEHGDGEMARAAACYADPRRPMRRVHHQPPRDPAYSFKIPAAWPWDAEWWKPGDRLRELVKAGALIAAEIDRLQRAALLSRPGVGA